MVKIIDLKFQGLEASIASFLVETSTGPVIVETGPHSCLPHLEHQLKAADYGIDDVAAVFLTHIHLDHAGAAWCFADAGADIYLHPFGARHMADPSKLMSSAKRIYQDKMDALWGDMRAIDEERLKIAEDGAAINIGDKRFIAHHTPGHAVHHIAWQCDDLLFAGDVAGVKIGSGPVVPPCPPPDINIEDWKTSIQRILKMDISVSHTLWCYQKR
ncbi:MAG: MBL fold metallo-hydrolase [Calditrichota bacterium]